MSTVTHLLNKTADRYRGTRVKDSQGGWTRTYAKVNSDVKVRIVPAGTSEINFAQTFKAEVTHVLYFEPDQTVARDDKWMIDSVEYLVQHVIKPSQECYKKALAEELQSGN